METLEFEGFGGVRLAADAFGSPSDPAVLLVPSGVQTREFWHGSAQALAAAGRYAICLDPRGHGDSGESPDGKYGLDSSIADLKSVLAALPSRAFVVAAGSGAISAMAAIGESTTQLVSGLALVDINIWFEQAEYERLRAAFQRRSVPGQDEAGILEAIAAAHPDEPRPAATERLLSAYAKDEAGHLTWRGDQRVLETSDLFEQQGRLSAAAGQIKVPVALIRGSLNQTISTETLQRLQALIQGSEIAEVDGAGHFFASDRDDAFNSILLDFLERHAPRQHLTYLGGSEPRVLRDALGCFGTGVTVITTLDVDGEPVGLTANSFTSVSLDPPLILFSLAASSANLSTFVAAGQFAVNVLHIGQQPLAGRFARRDVPRFDGLDWALRAKGGSPILAGSLASFDCKTYAVHEGGDHLIFIGEVKHAWFEPHRDPLLYFRGRYRRLHFS